MPKRLKYKIKEKINPIYMALRDLESYKFLVWLTKTFNPTITFEELGLKYNIDPRTAFNYFHQAEKQLKIPMLQRVEEGLNLLDDLWLKSIQANLEIGQPIVTIEYGKGRGFLKQKFEIDDKRSPEEFKANLVANTSRLLGSRLDMTEAILDRSMEVAIDLPKPQEGALEPQGEEIKPKEDKDEPKTEG